jgi:hypothetical protein
MEKHGRRKKGKGVKAKTNCTVSEYQSAGWCKDMLFEQKAALEPPTKNTHMMSTSKHTHIWAKQLVTLNQDNGYHLPAGCRLPLLLLPPDRTLCCQSRTHERRVCLWWKKNETETDFWLSAAAVRDSDVTDFRLRFPSQQTAVGM